MTRHASPLVLGVLIVVACSRFDAESGGPGETVDSGASGEGGLPGGEGGLPGGEGGLPGGEGGLPDAGPTVEVVATNLDGLRSIAVSATDVFAAGTGSVVRIKRPLATGQVNDTVDYVQNAKALAIHPDGNLLFVGPSNIGRWKSDADRDNHTGEPEGVDILFANGHVVGSFINRVNAYVLSPNYSLTGQVSDTQNPRPDGIASDGVTVWWANRDEGFIGRATSGFQSGSPYLQGVDAPTSVVVDADSLYIARNGAILKVAKTSPPNGDISGLAPLLPNLGKPVALTADDTDLYWLDAASGSLFRAPKTGGTPTELAPGGGNIDLGMPRLIVVDSKYVWWAQPIDKTIYRIAK